MSDLNEQTNELMQDLEFKKIMKHYSVTWI